MDQELEERQQWGTLWDLCQEKYGQFTQWREETPPEDKAEQVTAFVFKGLLNIGLSKAMGTAAQGAGEAAAQAVRATNASNLAIAAEGAAIAQGAARAETIADALTNAGIVAGRATRVVGPAALLSQQSSDQQPQGSSERPPQDDTQDQAQSSAVRAEKTYDTVEELIEAGTPYKRKKKGKARLGKIEGANPKETIDHFAKKYGCEIRKDPNKNPFIRTEDFRVGMHYSTHDNGTPTIDITLFAAKKIFKIRCT